MYEWYCRRTCMPWHQANLGKTSIFVRSAMFFVVFRFFSAVHVILLLENVNKLTTECRTSTLAPPPDIVNIFPEVITFFRKVV